MKIIETTILRYPDGTVTLQGRDIRPGEHRIIVVINEQPIMKGKRPPLKFSACRGIGRGRCDASQESLWRLGTVTRLYR